MENQTAELQCLLRIEILLTALVRSNLNNALTAIVANKRLCRLFELTGNATAREASQKTGMGLGSISRTWQGWRSSD